MLFDFYLFTLVFCALCCFRYQRRSQATEQLWYAFTDELASPWDTENIDLDLDNLTLSCKVVAPSFDAIDTHQNMVAVVVDDELAPPSDDQGNTLNYESWKMAQLRERAYQEGIQCSRMRKAELIQALEARDEERAAQAF